MTGSSSTIPRAARSGDAPARGGPLRRAAIAGGLGLLTLVAFLPSLDNGFVINWDDGPNLVENPHLRGLSWNSFSWAWHTYLLGVYQPLAWLLFLAESAVWGVAPWGYHLVSLLWHAANAIVFFVLTRALLEQARPEPELAAADRTFGAALAAGLFAVHPLRVEAVAWASCQPYLPCVFFGLLSVLMYLRAARAGAGGRRRFWLIVACWVLLLAALLCKSLAVPLPLIFLVLDVYPLRRLGAGGGPGPGAGRFVRGVWLEKLPFFLLGGLFAALAYRARSSLEVVARTRSLSARVAQVGYSLAYYPLKTVVPSDLMPFHPIRNGASLDEPRFQLCAASVLGLTILLFLLRRRWPGLLTGWVSYLLLIAPNSGIVRIGTMLVADRYSYLATMPGFVVAAGGIAALRSWGRTRWQGHRRLVTSGVTAVGLAAILALIPMSWWLCRVWNSSETAWTYSAACFARAVKAAPRRAEAHHNLGIALFYCRRLDEAIREFHTALELDPSLSETYGSLAQALIESGRNEEAMAALSEAVRLEPDDPDAHGARAYFLVKQGRLDEAQTEYLAALRGQPHSASWHAGLGVVLYRQGRIDAAAAELSEAVRLNPDDRYARDQLRQVRQAQGRR
jgi:Tfp pilus assembly protein PilF